MWGLGGRYYWGRKERFAKVEGIVVVFAWMSSQERHVKSYVQLYESLGWNSLVCHSQFLNLFFPEKATELAIDILNALIEELKRKPCPVVFASFSGGSKACMYKIFQIIEGNFEAQKNVDDYGLVRDCTSGFIYDSSPVDFTSDLGTRFVLHPSVLKISHPPRLASWIAHFIASGLDSLFLSRFESQRAEYWQTLYSSTKFQAPFLILCSEEDDLAPYQTICNFTQRLLDLGADVKLIKWNGSPHVGHYRLFPIDYKAAVTELLGKAGGVYRQKIRRLEGEKVGLEGTHDDIPETIANLRNMAGSSSSFQGFAFTPSGHFLLPSTMEYIDGADFQSMQNGNKEGMIHISSLPSISAHGVLGQILFDVCVPKNVEGWDIRPTDYLNGRPFSRNTSFNPIKCIRRSRL